MKTIVFANHELTPEFFQREYVEKGRSQTDIARQFGLRQPDVSYYMRKLGVTSRPRGPQMTFAEPNVSGFYGPASDWHAYWLGFIAADGCVYTEGKNRRHHLVRVKLHIKDVSHLANLRDGLRTDVPIREGERDGRGFAFVEFHSARFIQALARWGINQSKTTSLPFPEMESGSLLAFIRGYFDGDGTIYWRERSNRREPVCRFISGNPSFLVALAAAMTSFGVNVRPIYRNGAGNAHVLPLSNARANLRVFSSLIYPDGCVALARKKEAFKEL